MNETTKSKRRGIFLSVQMLVVPLILLYVCNVLARLSITSGFPKFWSQNIQLIALIISVAFLCLPWVFDRTIRNEIKKKKAKDPNEFEESILVIGFACTIVPALLGFFLFLSGGVFSVTLWLSIASFTVGVIWAVFSFTSYPKKMPANKSQERTE